MKPTEKQLNFIEEICYVLDLDEPQNLTKEEASKWISEHIDEYRMASNDAFYNWENEMLNG